MEIEKKLAIDREQLDPAMAESLKDVGYLQSREQQEKTGLLGRKYGEGRVQAVDMEELKR